MEKEIKITKQLSNQVEQMIILVSQVAKIKKEYPICWSILRNQFQLGDYQRSDFIEDDIENIKIKLYAEIISENTLNKKKLEKQVKAKLK